MASLNINSLLAHIDELRVFMSNSKIDILSINETKLDSTIKDSEVYLPGFEITRKDRKVNGRNGGGICMYVRCNLNYNQLINELINELNSRHPNKVKNIPEIKVREQTITEPSEIAE